jgi:hypothetical protein
VPLKPDLDPLGHRTADPDNSIRPYTADDMCGWGLCAGAGYLSKSLGCKGSDAEVEACWRAAPLDKLLDAQVSGRGGG